MTASPNAQEPLMLTFEEAFYLLGREQRSIYQDLSGKWMVLFPTTSYGFVKGIPTDSWDEAVGKYGLGRPVVRYGPTAELVEALEAIREKARMLVSGHPNPDNLAYWERLLLFGIAEGIDAVLAKVKGKS